MNEQTSPQDFARRITTAIKMADAAEAILERVRMAVNDPKCRTMPNSIGIDPMLLALAMELLLKAWITWDGRVSTKKLMVHELATLLATCSHISAKILRGPFCKPTRGLLQTGLSHTGET